MESVQFTYPRQTPNSILDWIEVGLSWLFYNVLWGLTPIIALLIVAAVLTGPSFDIGDEFRVGATVLALTLCATQLSDDVPIPPSRLIYWKWVKNASNFIFWGGGGFSVLNAFYQYKSVLFNIDTTVFNLFATALLLFAVAVAFWGFILKLAISINYDEDIVKNTEDLMEASKKIDHDDDGVAL